MKRRCGALSLSLSSSRIYTYTVLCSPFPPFVFHIASLSTLICIQTVTLCCSARVYTFQAAEEIDLCQSIYSGNDKLFFRPFYFRTCSHNNNKSNCLCVFAELCEIFGCKECAVLIRKDKSPKQRCSSWLFACQQIEMPARSSRGERERERDRTSEPVTFIKYSSQS